MYLRKDGEHYVTSADHGMELYSGESLVKEDGSADATYQYTDFGETTIQGNDQAKNEVCYTGGIYD